MIRGERCGLLGTRHTGRDRLYRCIVYGGGLVTRLRCATTQPPCVWRPLMHARGRARDAIGSCECTSSARRSSTLKRRLSVRLLRELRVVVLSARPGERMAAARQLSPRAPRWKFAKTRAVYL